MKKLLLLLLLPANFAGAMQREAHPDTKETITRIHNATDIQRIVRVIDTAGN